MESNTLTANEAGMASSIGDEQSAVRMMD